MAGATTITSEELNVMVVLPGRCLQWVATIGAEADSVIKSTLPL